MEIYSDTSKVDLFKGLPITPHVLLAHFTDLAACFDQFKEGLVPSETGEIFPVNYNMEDSNLDNIQWTPT